VEADRRTEESDREAAAGPQTAGRHGVNPEDATAFGGRGLELNDRLADGHRGQIRDTGDQQQDHGEQIVVGDREP